MWFDTLAEVDNWVDNNPCGPDGTWAGFGYSAEQCSVEWKPYFFYITYWE